MQAITDLLEYDPNSGDLTWKSYQNSQAVAGQKAGTIDFHGYVMVGIKKRYYKGHRLAWFLHYGRWPTGQIDHINHCRSDNRISNLREVSQSENLRNKKMSKANTSGHTGVTRTQSGAWLARICVNRVSICLGSYKTIEEAVAAREAANVTYNFHTNHGQ